LKYKMFIKQIKFDAHGLVPAIIQDAAGKKVLMVAFMNREALTKTLASGKTHFYSRSRKKLWLKGESSGHTQTVKGIFFDCDSDCLLIKVKQKGAACHNGYAGCFYRKFDPKSGKISVVGKKVFDPKKVYKK